MLKFVLLGDSLTYGFAVPQEKKWSGLLQQRRIDVDFINKGICGDTTGGMLARFADEVETMINIITANSAGNVGYKA